MTLHVTPARLGASHVDALEAGLERVRRAASMPEAIRAAWDLAEVRLVPDEDDPSPWLDVLRGSVRDEHDGIVAIAATHAMARLQGPDVDAELGRIVTDDVPGIATHVLWAMRGRHPRRDLIGTLAQRVERGGLDGSHAQWLLARWGLQDGLRTAVLEALAERLDRAGWAPARRWLVETVGMLPGRASRDLLVRRALDDGEDASVRRAAVAAFSERTWELLPPALAAISRRTDDLAACARLVRAQRRLVQRMRRRGADPLALRVAQVHLGAVLDPGASHAGMGDAGGVATLLSRLGTVLAERPEVSEVVTIGRSAAGHDGGAPGSANGHRFESVALEPGEAISFAGLWPGLMAARRGIRAALLADRIPDVLHLRMADPGTLAAAQVAQELAIPIVFTLAPDPHGPIAAAERAGTLDRRAFVAADARDHLWFRMRLVDELAREAKQVVLFPRPDLARQLRDLVGVDLATGARRYTIVPEGVDTRIADRARAAILGVGIAGHASVAALLAGIARLPGDRHGLPLVVSIGRLSEVKGMARIVQAFGSERTLSDRANLVIVGGDLARPNSAEAEELARIHAELDRHPWLRDGVVLLGHLPNEQVGLVLAAARHGLAPLVGPCGAYACGSRKEEFGLAIVEAMAAGLPVVAPREGGPPTYVQDGVTGLLVDTTDALAIGQGLLGALELAREPAVADRTRAVVESRFTLERMAQALVPVYRRGAGHPGTPVSARALAVPGARGIAA
jgi:glycosyltransferase involved in cell wall biosynthesis